jgi:predicted phosphodiesterase
MDSIRTLNISDVHSPFHDPYAVDLALRIVGVYQPHVVIFNGDISDFYDVSDFDKNPERVRNGGLQAELNQTKEIIGRFRDAAPTGCKLKLQPGNHEDRLRRYLWRHPQLYGLEVLELHNLLELARFGVEYYPEEIKLANGNLIVKHGTFVRKWGGLTAVAELEAEKFAVSTLTGHTHRMGFSMVRHRLGLVGGWEGGCLCDLNPEYVKRPNWQQGVTLISESVGGDSFSVTPVPFLGAGADLKAMVEGRTVRL